MLTKYASISELQELLRTKTATVGEVVNGSLTAAQGDQERLGAYITFRDPSYEIKLADDRLTNQTARPLEGIPIAVKDNLPIRGEITTAGSQILKDHQAVFTATAVKRLTDAGAIVIGKTNLDEFGMGASTEFSSFHPTRNPWDPKLVPGGSSGGSAASVAAGHVPVALGTDTGGSVRQPASFCGVVGFKPTYGRISRSGLIALASSLDHVGVFGRTVDDVVRVYQIIAGHDQADATTVDRPVEIHPVDQAANLSGLRIGLPKEYFGAGVDREIAAAIKTAAEVIKKLGAELIPVSLPHVSYALATYYIIMPAEASSNLARYDGIRYGLADKTAANLFEHYAQSRALGFGPEVKRRIMVGTYVLSSGYADAYYHQAVRVRETLREEFHQVFDQVDLLLGPTSPIKPFTLGEKKADPLAMYLADLLTVPANLTGLPAISVPAGLVDGLPVGMQLIGRAWDENCVLQTARAFEQATDWHNQHPPE